MTWNRRRSDSLAMPPLRQPSANMKASDAMEAERDIKDLAESTESKNLRRTTELLGAKPDAKESFHIRQSRRFASSETDTRDHCSFIRSAQRQDNDQRDNDECSVSQRKQRVRFVDDACY